MSHKEMHPHPILTDIKTDGGSSDVTPASSPKYDMTKLTTNLENAHDMGIYKYVIRDKETNSEWTRDMEELVYGWGQKGVGFRHMHDMASRYFRSWSQGLGIPAIILSTVAGTASLSKVASGSHYGDTAAIAIGVVSMVVSALTGVQNFMQFTRRSEQHKQMSNRFGSFFREIDCELTKPRAHRQNAFEFIQVCRLTLDNLLAQGPDMPEFIAQRYRRKVRETGEGSESGAGPGKVVVSVKRDREAHAVVRIMGAAG